MSKFRETKLPCENCGSSDARAIYHSGVSICFSCGERHAPQAEHASVGKRDFKRGRFVALKKRGIREETCRRYGYELSDDNKCQIAPYYDTSGRLVAQKLRTPDKKFSITGDAGKMGLFGAQLMRRGGKLVVITEGEIDALSVSQALGNTWPVVSLPNGAQNLKPLKDSLELLETFERVVLCFDNDEPGYTATEAALGLLSPGKAYVTDLGGVKDANELLKQDPAALRNAIWAAREHRPDGVVNLQEYEERIRAPVKQGTQYPWDGLNKYLFGYRPQELVTWCAGTGVGKSAVVSELAYDMIVNKGLKVGLIYLEESIERTARRLMAIHMDKPIHLPDVEPTEEEFNDAWSATMGTGRVVAWDHFGSADVDLLANRVRWLRNGFDVDVVILDHISMVVSGADLDADERRLLDVAMTNLRSLTQETGLTIHNVSHLKRGNGTPHEEGGHVSLQHLRGTQAIGQLSDAVIGLERNQQADGTDRNLTGIRVLKNRFAGLTGSACQLRFNPITHRLTEVDECSKKPTQEMNGDF